MEEKQKKEQIRSAIAGLPEKVVRDALAISLTNSNSQAETVQEKNLETEGFQDIFDLVTYLKRTYTFAELDHLVIEGGKLFFKDGDRRILMGEKEYQIGDNIQRPSTRSAGQQKPNEKQNTPSPPGNESERFSRLELDD